MARERVAVVDALEFVLTGNVSRLSGEGRGDISLKQHGPHVDRRNDPDKARVTVKVTIPSLNKTVTIERSVKTPAAAARDAERSRSARSAWTSEGAS